MIPIPAHIIDSLLSRAVPISRTQGEWCLLDTGSQEVVWFGNTVILGFGQRASTGPIAAVYRCQ